MARSSPLNDPLPAPKLASALQRNRVTASELAIRGREQSCVLYAASTGTPPVCVRVNVSVSVEAVSDCS